MQSLHLKLISIHMITAKGVAYEVTFKLSRPNTADTVDVARVMHILQQLSGRSGIYTLNGLDIRTREEQGIGACGQDDTANTGINMFLEAIEHHVLTSN